MRLLLLALITLATLSISTTFAADKPAFYDPAERQLEGWTIKVDPQLLTKENEEVATYDNAKEKNLYDEVLLYTGQKVRHYGLTNHKEYFAESTEAYFGVNDFYPFVRAELKEHDPTMFKLLEKIWGPVR